MDIDRKILKAEKIVEIRFNEVDSMGIVWHGSYPLYFEDAREEFGKIYHLEYLYMFDKGFYSPLVEMHFNYKSPIKYTDKIRVVITYRNTEAAKIVFDYEIFDVVTGELRATGYTTQVFLDKNFELMWTKPDFYCEWEKLNGIR
ncbi:MAG: acyl-CoA thioesterase [Bacteroidales bacterium]|jgi:acyl-CoA thioester hydrolase|nr:acyl-CoA thioesterase [Bacteroidales bacterium]MDD2204153.1 acyl-CoA thioesterase [Bacteroidales bacterium]MDD3151799.1 acyl-CoA thioesterase [Bacteroidales bacterium]MDD3914724.1 acyl-CoA thioesterase [Bacteroidales bacterium]MDD4633582.1 acyl-CoA thioesterase [Bacteroidales bacterium]